MSALRRILFSLSYCLTLCSENNNFGDSFIKPLNQIISKIVLTIFINWKGFRFE